MTSHNNRIFFLGFNNIVQSLYDKLFKDGVTFTVITDESHENKIDNADLKEITHICKNSKELLKYFQSIKIDNNDIIISIGCPWILQKEHIVALKNNIYNLHGTQLPRFRGGTIFSWQILTGNRVGMCLLHKLVPEIDSGPIVDFEEFIYPSACHKPLDYMMHYEKKNTKFLFDILIKMINNKFHPIETQQPEYLSSYLPRLRADVHGWIDWSWNALELERFICAFDEPYGGARCRLNGQVVLIKDVYSQATDGYTHPFQNGLIYRKNTNRINVTVNGGELLICSILDEGGNNIMPGINLGSRLYSTFEDLLESKKTVVKTSKGLMVKK